MNTQTTIEAVERTPSGNLKITFAGGAVAGAKDADIIATAERVAAQESPNPVQITVQKIEGDKLLVTGMEEITPPEELGGEPEPETAPVAAEAEPTLDDVLMKGLEAYSDEALLAEVARRMK